MVAKRYVLLDVANKHNLIGFEKACTLRTAELHGCKKAYSPFSQHLIKFTFSRPQIHFRNNQPDTTRKKFNN